MRPAKTATGARAERSPRVGGGSGWDPRGLLVMEAAGNRFAVADLLAPDPPSIASDPSSLARAICGPAGLDGLLLLARPRGRGACRMILHNADGSRAQACGNGLRCVAKVAFERGYAEGTEVAVETDAGTRSVLVLLEGGKVVSAVAEMGAPRAMVAPERLLVDRCELEVFPVELGNPHCVLFVESAAAAPVAELGPRLERLGRFPARVNVGFAEVRGEGLRLRVWERGVGETASCGTGAAAAAVAGIVSGRISSPVAVEMGGGTLRVEWDGRGDLRVFGPVRSEGPLRSASLPGGG